MQPKKSNRGLLTYSRKFEDKKDNLLFLALLVALLRVENIQLVCYYGQSSQNSEYCKQSCTWYMMKTKSYINKMVYKESCLPRK